MSITCDFSLTRSVSTTEAGITFIRISGVILIYGLLTEQQPRNNYN